MRASKNRPQLILISLNDTMFKKVNGVWEGTNTKKEKKTRRTKSQMRKVIEEVEKSSCFSLTDPFNELLPHDDEIRFSPDDNEFDDRDFGSRILCVDEIPIEFQ